MKYITHKMLPMTAALAVAYSLVQAQDAAFPESDPTFNPPPEAFTQLLALSDKKYLVAGRFQFLDGLPLNQVARLNPDGSVDDTFDSGEGNNLTVVEGILVQPDRRVIVWGRFADYRGAVRQRVARLLPNGQLDSGFAPPVETTFNSNLQVKGLALDATSGGIYLGTSFRFSGPPTYGNQQLARLHPNGELDTSFAPQPAHEGPASASAVTVDAEGRILVAGSYTTAPAYGIRRFLPDGTLDPSFKRVAIEATGGEYEVTQMVVQPDGLILVSGGFNRINQQARPGIARLRSDGALDPAFRPPSTLAAASSIPVIKKMALQSDGAVWIGGYRPDGPRRVPFLTRLLPDGSLAEGSSAEFDPNAQTYGQVAALALQGEGHLVIAGDFRLKNGGREDCLRIALGDSEVRAHARIGDEQVEWKAQVHPGRIYQAEVADRLEGTWRPIGATNPVASGVWGIPQHTGTSESGFFRVR